MKNLSVDVVVVGGGIAGLALATSLRRHGELSVAVIEARPPAAAEAGLDLRVSALSPDSLAWLAGIGAWPVDASRYCAYRDMIIWQGDAAGQNHRLQFSAAETGVPELGCIVENQALRRALWARLAECDSDSLLVDSVKRIVRNADSVVVECDDARVSARLLVAADGAHSGIRDQLGIEQRQKNYGQNALVAHLAVEKPHAATAWQKFLPGGPLALLPLPDGRVSLVWSHPEAETDALLALADADFAARLTGASDAILGKLECTSARASFPLARAHARRYTGRRFALLGDAAHRVHPLAGQGANLGLRDAAALAAELQAHLVSRFADPGDPIVLRRYERRRKGDNALMIGAMDALDALFRSPFARFAGRGMGAVNELAVLKSRLAGHAMGISPR